MAKKYLLYIHDERFQKEKKKSALVNDLLEKHYGGFVKASEALNKAKVPAEDRAGIVEVCNGHPAFRRDCGLIGCKYV